MANKAKSIHIRLNRNDYDLLLLASQSKMSVLVKKAIRNYLAGEREDLISLPVYIQMPQVYKAVNVRLDEERDADIISFIESIPNGNRNYVYKALLRHSMECPDVRQWISDPLAAKRPKAMLVSTNTEKKPKPRTQEEKPVEPIAQLIRKKPLAEPTPAGSDEEDIFSLI